VKPIFLLSYSHYDKALAADLLRLLIDSGAEVLQDEISIGFGKPIPESVRDLVRRATHLLALWSPESKKSNWVSFEMGMAWALQREVWCFLSEPEIAPPDFLAHLRHLTSFEQLQGAVRDIISGRQDEHMADLGPVARFAKNRLFDSPTGYAPAVRLFGADDEYFTEKYCVISYRHDEFVRPLELLPYCDRILQRKEEEAVRRGALRFNGPNTRLIEWRANPIGETDSVIERRTLNLLLGPVGWFDFEGLNEAFREQATHGDLLEACLRFVGLEEVVSNGSVQYCKLSNILDTASTIFTRDGFLGYQKRSSRVSAVPSTFTSGIAENINRYLDDADPHDSQKFFNPLPEGPWPEEAQSNDYVPKGVPHPFSAVRRGLREEVSRLIIPHVGPNAIKLMSISFDLEALHPDLLFLITVDMTAEEILRSAGSQPGRDYFEGQLRFVRADAAAFSAEEEIVKGSWVAAGKAALFRALQLIEVLKSARGLGDSQLFELLRDAM